MHSGANVVIFSLVERLLPPNVPRIPYFPTTVKSSTLSSLHISSQSLHSLLHHFQQFEHILVFAKFKSNGNNALSRFLSPFQRMPQSNIKLGPQFVELCLNFLAL